MEMNGKALWKRQFAVLEEGWNQSALWTGNRVGHTMTGNENGMERKLKGD